ncbi:hypothetical protein ACEPPN_017891 [Leptodophora sp. 'Broadleaf-Isolate-01']
MPVQLIRTLNRPRREKILISCLMALGLLATGIAAYKMTLSQLSHSGDLLATTVKASLWCKLEEQVGIIAACLPCLKSPAERVLRRVGIVMSQPKQFISRPSFVITLKQESGSPSSQTAPADYTARDMDEVNRNESHVGLVKSINTIGTSTTLKSTTGNLE